VLTRLLYILLDAEPVEVDNELIINYVKELSPFQYEASMHDFYNIYIPNPLTPFNSAYEAAHA
jgi:hypothetical protein